MYSVKGAGHADIISMCIIFLLAGAFGTVTKTIGGVDSIVNLSLSVLPATLVVVGLFLIGCFISLSMGTSVGTIAAIAPIGIGVAEATENICSFSIRCCSWWSYVWR